MADTQYRVWYGTDIADGPTQGLVQGMTVIGCRPFAPMNLPHNPHAIPAYLLKQRL